MILPTRKLILLLAVPAVVVAVAPWRPLITAMVAYDLAVALLVALDLARSARPGQVRVERRLAPRLSLGGANAVGWTIHNASDQDLLLTITDTVPEAVVSLYPSALSSKIGVAGFEPTTSCTQIAAGP